MIFYRWLKLQPFINPFPVLFHMWQAVKIDGEALQLLRILKVEMRAHSYGDVIRKLSAIYVKYRILEENFPDVANKVEDIYAELRRQRKMSMRQIPE